MTAGAQRHKRREAALILASLVVFEATVVLSGHRRLPAVAAIFVAALMIAALVVRRGAPLAFVCVTTIGAVVLLNDVVSSVAGLYVLLVPAYVVAAYGSSRSAGMGLVIVVGAAWTIEALNEARTSAWVFSAAVVGAAWTWGRAVSRRRTLAQRLERSASQLAAEEETRQLLAVADERTRIARELQAVIARSVSLMVCEARAAQHLLMAGAEEADSALASLETTGRQTLSEMRRLLGVLRHSDNGAELQPQPRLGQILGLVERARHSGRNVAFDLVGEPRPVSASSEITVYRIIEEALDGSATAKMWLTFDAEAVTLRIEARGRLQAWPSDRIRERITLCDGALQCDATERNGRRLSVTIPIAVESVTV